MDTADFRNFLTAGRATFTVTSRKTGARFTYRVSATDDDPSRFFVAVLTGPDNGHNYTYAGMLHLGVRGNLTARQTRGSKVSGTAASWCGFRWLIGMVDAGRDVAAQAEIDHEGACGRCGRALTVPESIRSGLGPVCAARVAS